MILLNRCQLNGPVKMYKLRRDGQRPLEFEGRPIAGVEVAGCDCLAISRLFIYMTRGKRYVAEFSRRLAPGVEPDAAPVELRLANRSMAFDRLEEAVGFFWPGRPVDELKAQLGMLDPEIVE